MKKPFLIAATLAVTAITLAGCSLSGSSSPSKTTASSAPIKVGIVVSASGAYSILGIPQEEALKLRAQEIDKAGGIMGRQVELTFVDDTTDPAKGAQLFNQLASEGDYDALMSSPFVSSTEAAAPLAEQYKIPTMALGPSDKLADGSNPWVFVANGDSDLVAHATLDYMKDSGKFHKLAIVYIGNDAYGVNGNTATQDWAKKDGLTIAGSQAIDRSTTDFSSTIQNVKSSGADSVIVWGSGPAPSIFTAQWSKLAAGSGIQLFMTPAQATQLYTMVKGQPFTAANGVMTAADNPVLGDQLPQNYWQTKLVNTFASEWSTVGDTSYSYPPSFAFYAASALDVVKAGIEKAGTTDHKAVRDAIESLNLKTMTGVWAFSKTKHVGNNTDEYQIATVQDGKFIATDYSLKKLAQLK